MTAELTLIGVVQSEDEKIATNSRKKSFKNRTIARLLFKIVCLMFKVLFFALWKQIDRKK
jgi:hypothetical protein